MKLVIAIVQDEDAGKVTDALVKGGFRSTRFQSHGGHATFPLQIQGH